MFTTDLGKTLTLRQENKGVNSGNSNGSVF